MSESRKTNKINHNLRCDICKRFVKKDEFKAQIKDNLPESLLCKKCYNEHFNLDRL
jgi:hypothetical protein